MVAGVEGDHVDSPEWLLPTFPTQHRSVQPQSGSQKAAKIAKISKTAKHSGRL